MRMLPPFEEWRQAMRGPAGRGVAFLLFALASTGAFDARAQADESLNLTLRKTYLKSVSGTMTVQEAPSDAFTPTMVICPNDTSAGCTIRVEVSSTFEQIEAGAVAMMQARIDTFPAPPGQVEVESSNTGTLGSARTFAWFRTGVAPGSHVVDVEFLMSGTGAAAQAGQRTLTIDIYKVPVFILP
jgi:hypothetical protein